MAAKWKTISREKMLLREFNRQTEAAQTHTQKMMESLSEGKVPDQDTSDNLDKAMTALQDQYNKIYAAAKENLSTTEMPRAGSPAEDYIIATCNSKPVLIENRRKLQKHWRLSTVSLNFWILKS